MEKKLPEISPNINPKMNDKIGIVVGIYGIYDFIDQVIKSIKD